MNDTIEFRKKSFGSMAEDYQKYRKPYDPVIYERFFSLLSEQKGSLKVLDIGCGTGKSTEPLIQNAPVRLKDRIEVVGCDPDVQMLDQAKQSASEKKLSIKYVVGEAEKLPFQENEFDAVIAGTAFHWFATEAAFKEICRSIRPCGFFLVFWKLPTRILDKQGRSVATDVYQKYSSRSVLKMWRDPEKTKALFESGGFTDFHMFTLETEQKDTLDELIGGHKTNSKFALLSKENQISFIKELTEAFTKALDGRPYFTSTRETVACYAFKG